MPSLPTTSKCTTGAPMTVSSYLVGWASSLFMQTSGRGRTNRLAHQPTDRAGDDCLPTLGTSLSAPQRWTRLARARGAGRRVRDVVLHAKGRRRQGRALARSRSRGYRGGSARPLSLSRVMDAAPATKAGSAQSATDQVRALAASSPHRRPGASAEPTARAAPPNQLDGAAYFRTSWPSQRLKLSSPLRYDAQVLLTDTSLNVVANVSSTAGVKTVASTLVWAYCTPSLVKACTRLTRLPAEVVAAGTVGDLSLIHISEPTRLLSISYAVFCLKKKKN